jgi:hypothetical protein
MKKISIAFLAAMSLASFGCPKKTGGGDAIAKMSEFKDRMCGCKDKTCSDKVSEDMLKWSQGAAKTGADKSAVNEDEAKKLAAVTEELTKCMTKIMSEAGGAGAGATPPPVPPADPAAGSAAPAAGSAAPAAGSAADPAAGSATK